jgi:hypothetical protein
VTFAILYLSSFVLLFIGEHGIPNPRLVLVDYFRQVEPLKDSKVDDQ